MGHLNKKDLMYVVDNQIEFSLYGVICFQKRSKVSFSKYKCFKNDTAICSDYNKSFTIFGKKLLCCTVMCSTQNVRIMKKNREKCTSECEFLLNDTKITNRIKMFR